MEDSSRSSWLSKKKKTASSLHYSPTSSPPSTRSSTLSLTSLYSTADASSSLLMSTSSPVPRYGRAADTDAEGEADGIFRERPDADADESEDHTTTAWQSFIHLLKGNVGPGCLSLPWAFSQLGVVGGSIACVVLAYWSSYNSWCVVVLRRHLQDEKERERTNAGTDSEAQERSDALAAELDNDNDSDNEPRRALVTYPDLGTWAYGKNFRDYVTMCICTQQLAVCTVFFSFIGENVLVVLGHLEIADPTDSWSHTLVLLSSLPPILALACLPDLKALAPVMMLATALLLFGFALLLAVAAVEWAGKNQNVESIYTETEMLQEDASPTPYSVPLALCAILYSFEGICLLFPVESSMARPRKEFGNVFVTAMVAVPLIYILISSSCVAAFGNVTNGSITAFLLEGDVFRGLSSDWSRSLLLLANTVVTISVLLTYPLQLYPALELLGPWWAGGQINPGAMIDDDSVSVSITGEAPTEGRPQGARTAFVRVNTEDEDEEGRLQLNTPGGPVLDRRTTSITMATNGDESQAISVSNDQQIRTFHGDSPQIRLALVTLTFVIAAVIPNVQALISLAGALAGSSIALIIPPLLELQYRKRVVQEDGGMVSTIRCYTLLALGGLFLVIGTSASVLDIVQIYRSG